MDENYINSFITIGNKKIPVKIMDIDVSQLKFYPENPRVYSALNSDGTVPSQDDIEQHMCALEHVKDLRDDIERNGGLMEEVIVRDIDYVTLEGNSRLAAYRLLNQKDPIKWDKIKCKVLPNNIDESLIFKLIGQFHIKGKKPWDAFEQASYLERRSKSTKMPIDELAKELGIQPKEARSMIEAVRLMHEYSEFDNHKYSYYKEYVKDNNIKKYRETHADMDNVVVKQIQNGEIQAAEDIRLIAKIAKVGDKTSKKLMNEIIEEKTSIYEAYDRMEDTGKLESSVNKLKSFKVYIDSDIFEKNVHSSKQTYDAARMEMDKIQRKINQLLKKWDKDNGK